MDIESIAYWGVFLLFFLPHIIRLIVVLEHVEYMRSKGKFVPGAVFIYGHGGIAPHILNLSIR
jgi:hypothetical protein